MNSALTHLIPVALVVAVAGCGGKDTTYRQIITETPSSSTPTAPAAPSTPTADVRVLHASVDAPPVDVYVDGALGLSNLSYGQGTAYVPLPAGARNLTVTANGSSAAVIATTVELLEGSRSTVIAIGRLQSIEPLLLGDDPIPPAPDHVKLRVVHAHPVAGQVDVYVTAPGANLATSTPTLALFTFRDASPALEVPAGDYQIRLTPAGSLTIAYDSGSVALIGGQNLTLAAIESSGGVSPVELAVLTGDPTAPSLNLIDVR